MTSIKNILICGIFLSLILVSCNEKKSPLLNKNVTSENITELVAELSGDKLISQTDFNSFANGIKSYNNKLDSLNGKTVSDIIKERQDAVRNANAVQTQRETTLMQLNHSLGFGIKGITPQKDKAGNDYNVAVFQVQNKSEKEIAIVKGIINIKVKANNNIIKQLPVTINRPIKADKQVVNMQNPYKHDANNQRDVLMRANLDKMVADWQPRYIEFTDGSKIEMK